MLVPSLLLLMVGPGAVSAATTSISEGDIQAQLKIHRSAKWEYCAARDAWEKLHLPEPVDLQRALPEPATVESATLAFQEAYKLQQAAAYELLVFVSFAYSPCDSEIVGGYEAAAVEAGFAASRSAPDAVGPLLALLVSRMAAKPDFRGRVLTQVETGELPVRLAMGLLAPLAGYAWESVLASYAVGREPNSLLAAVQERSRPYAGFTPFDLAAYRALSQTERASEVGLKLGRLVLLGLLELGQSRLARDLLASMPESARTTIRRENRPATNVDPASASELPALLAAAYIEVGDKKEARSWIGLAPTNAVDPHPNADCLVPSANQLLAAALIGVAANPFQLLVASRACGAPSVNPWPSIEAILLGGSYPDHVRERFLSVLEYSPYRRDELLARLPFTKQAVRDLDKGREHEKAVATQWLSTHPARPELAKPSLSVAARQLAAPPLRVFTEGKLADLPVLPGPSPWQVLKEKSLKLPPGFWFIRGEQKQAETVVLALSQRLDPTGELTGGGYWLLLSKNGGATWEPPLYTGLRALYPYELATHSTQPILQGQAVRLEATRRELDESSITFPPVALRTRTLASGLVLTSSLDSLRRDSDGDGLADVVEDRLLLDPMNPDSDADGILDGQDSVPHIPNGTTVLSRESELMTEVLFRLTQPKTRMQGFVTGADRSGDNMPAMVPAPEALDGILYLETTAVVGLARGSPVRVIALTPDEVSAACRRFGIFYPMRLKIFFNPSKDEALIEWDETWRGGGGRAKWDNGWKLEIKGGWVT